jgi:hypothetical protein
MALIDWIEQERQRIHEHFEAFSAVAGRQPDGLTLFQHQAMDALAPVIPQQSFHRDASTDASGEVLVAPLGNTGLHVNIFSNYSGIFGPQTNVWMEDWDFHTPQELYATLVREVASRAA